MAINLSDLPPRMQKQALRIIAEEDARRNRGLLSGSDEGLEEPTEKKSKYHAKKVTTTLEDGTPWTFDSLKEYGRYQELVLMQQAGEISELDIQKEFVLLPKQRTSDGRVVREVKYIADFVYKTKDSDVIVEDVKSPATKTQVYKLKKKLMLYVHGIEIQEI